jgi:hypothetical protein
VAALVLAAFGLLAGGPKSSMWTYGTVALFGVAASLGPHGLWGWSIEGVLYSLVPIFHGLRQVSRFGVLALFGISVLAAYGCAALETVWVDSGSNLLKAGVLAMAFLELMPAPLRTDRPRGVALSAIPDTPPAYRWLAQQPGSFTILELPFPPPVVLWRNAPYVFWSTLHWQRLVNGYSGFPSQGYQSLFEMLKTFPDPVSIGALSARHVRYVLVHWDLYYPGDVPADAKKMRELPDFRLVATFPGVDVFEFEPSLQVSASRVNGH